MNCPLTKKLNITFLLKAVINGATLRALNFWLSVFTIEFALALKLLTFICYNTKGFMFSLPACLLAYFKWLIDNVFLMSLIKGTLMQIWKSCNIPVFIWKNMLKISHLNNFYFLRYVHVRYVNSLFTYILKQ